MEGLARSLLPLALIGALLGAIPFYLTTQKEMVFGPESWKSVTERIEAKDMSGVFITNACVTKALAPASCPGFSDPKVTSYTSSGCLKGGKLGEIDARGRCDVSAGNGPGAYWLIDDHPQMVWDSLTKQVVHQHSAKWHDNYLAIAASYIHDNGLSQEFLLKEYLVGVGGLVLLIALFTLGYCRSESYTVFDFGNFEQFIKLPAILTIAGTIALIYAGSLIQEQKEVITELNTHLAAADIEGSKFFKPFPQTYIAPLDENDPYRYGALAAAVLTVPLLMMLPIFLVGSVIGLGSIYYGFSVPTVAGGRRLLRAIPTFGLVFFIGALIYLAMELTGREYAHDQKHQALDERIQAGDVQGLFVSARCFHASKYRKVSQLCSYTKGLAIPPINSIPIRWNVCHTGSALGIIVQGGRCVVLKGMGSGDLRLARYGVTNDAAWNAETNRPMKLEYDGLSGVVVATLTDIREDITLPNFLIASVVLGFLLFIFQNGVAVQEGWAFKMGEFARSSFIPLSAGLGLFMLLAWYIGGIFQEHHNAIWHDGIVLRNAAIAGTDYFNPIVGDTFFTRGYDDTADLVLFFGVPLLIAILTCIPLVIIGSFFAFVTGLFDLFVPSTSARGKRKTQKKFSISDILSGAVSMIASPFRRMSNENQARKTQAIASELEAQADVSDAEIEFMKAKKAAAEAEVRLKTLKKRSK